MATRIHESGAIDAPIDRVWDILRPLDFSFLPAIANSAVEDGQNPSRVGGVRRLIYKDGTLQRVKLMELNDSTHTVTYDVITSEPAVEYSSAVHTIKLRRVTFGAKTLVELISDYSSDASSPVLTDARYKRQDILNGLRDAVAAQKDPTVSLDGFRKRATLAETLIASLSERLAALEARRSGTDTKDGQIFLHITGEFKDSSFVDKQGAYAKKVQKELAGVLLHTGATLLHDKQYTTFIAFRSDASLQEYFNSSLFKSRDVSKEITNTHYSVFGPVSKASKELLSEYAKTSYLEFNGFIRP